MLILNHTSTDTTSGNQHARIIDFLTALHSNVGDKREEIVDQMIADSVKNMVFPEGKTGLFNMSLRGSLRPHALEALLDHKTRPTDNGGQFVGRHVALSELRYETISVYNEKYSFVSETTQLRHNPAKALPLFVNTYELLLNFLKEDMENGAVSIEPGSTIWIGGTAINITEKGYEIWSKEFSFLRNQMQGTWTTVRSLIKHERKALAAIKELYSL